jgi:threonine/homoserine/homoserine lactone efflux protein
MTLGIHDLPLYLASGILLNIAPGPDSLLVTMRSAAQGWRAGSMAALGVASGVFVHISAAALGVSALIAASASAFAILKYAGAAYLVYIGVRMVFAKSSAAGMVGEPPAAALTYRRIYVQGFLTNALNPKVALFFLAFVPQFIASDSTAKALAFVLLGLIFDFNGLLWCVFLAWFVARVRASMRPSERARRWFSRVIGGLFVALGVRLALARAS